MTDQPPAPGASPAPEPAEEVRLDDLTEGLVLAPARPAPSPEVEESPTARAGEVLAQRYVIKRLIARGGMGRVYLATQVPLGRDVAVKCLIPRTNDREFRQRFFLEASTCARLTHRHIVTVHDYGETEGGELYMAMEHLRGEPLSQVLGKGGRLDAARAAHIALQVARALRAAHRRGVIHRDLKPGNVMLVEDDEQTSRDFVKVLDFGLVKVFEPAGPGVDAGDLTLAGVWLGSPRYMAPEQIRCAEVDPRTDFYALGAILFHMLAGRPPFTGSSSAEIFGQHLRDPVPSIHALSGAEPPPELERIARRCLEKSPDARYERVDELIAELYAALSALVGSGGRLVASDASAISSLPGLESMLDEGSGLLAPMRPREGSVSGRAAEPSYPSQPSHPSLSSESGSRSAVVARDVIAPPLVARADAGPLARELRAPSLSREDAPRAASLSPLDLLAAPSLPPRGVSEPPQALTALDHGPPVPGAAVTMRAPQWPAPEAMLAPSLSGSFPPVTAGAPSEVTGVTGMGAAAAPRAGGPRALYALVGLLVVLVAIMGVLLVTRPPTDEAPAERAAEPAAGPTAPAPPTLADLEQQLEAALAKRGMVPADLALLPELKPTYETWQAQRGAGEPARPALVSLLGAAATAPFNEAILNKYLDRLDSAVAAQGDKLPPPKFEALKQEYLDLYRQVQLASTPPEREVMVQAIQRFERKMVQ